MVNAVNSVSANASLLRNEANTVRADAARNAPEPSVAVKSEPVSEMPQAPFISPVVSIDPQFNTAVLLLRNSEDGEVQDQIPSESALRAIQRQNSSDSQIPAPQEAQTNQSPNTSDGARLQQSVSTTNFVQTISTAQSTENDSVSTNSLESLATQAFQSSQGSIQLGSSVNVSA